MDDYHGAIQNANIAKRMARLRESELGYDHVDVQMVSADDSAEFEK